MSGHTDCVRLLVEAGANKEATSTIRGILSPRTHEGCTALLHAADGGHTDCVSALIEAGADKDARTNVRDSR